MYEDMKQFLQGRDPTYMRELQLINNQDLSHLNSVPSRSVSQTGPHERKGIQNQESATVIIGGSPIEKRAASALNEEAGPNEEELQIIKKYKQTEAYQRLVKRQGLAVRRLERIKANFEKKRKQVGMIEVKNEMSMRIEGWPVNWPADRPIYSQ